MPSSVNNQMINADDATDQPKLPATGSTNPPTSASNTLAFVTRNAKTTNASDALQPIYPAQLRSEIIVVVIQLHVVIAFAASVSRERLFGTNTRGFMVMMNNVGQLPFPQRDVCKTYPAL